MTSWTDCGVALEASPEEGQIQNFTCAAEALDGDNWRLWYSSHGENGFNIGVAEGVPAKGMRRLPVSIANLPAGWRPFQPVFLRLPDGSSRLYFWAHAAAEGVVRYLCALGDGRNFEVVDPRRPCLYHYNDRAVPASLFGPAGLTFGKRDLPRPSSEPEALPEALSNDATNVYVLPDGAFEMFTVHISPVGKDDPRYIAHDNASGWVRSIYRRSSADGLVWSPGQQVVAPDGDDPACLQFYYLAAAHLPEGRVGMLGRYDVHAQTMDIEWCFSVDGVKWERPARGAWLPRRPGEHGIYAPHAPVKVNGVWHLFYTSCNYTHNYSEVGGGAPASHIRLARIDSLLG